jgi:hypothetical protein
MKRKEAASYAPNAPLLKSVARLPKIKHSAAHEKSVRTFDHKRAMQSHHRPYVLYDQGIIRAQPALRVDLAL